MFDIRSILSAAGDESLERLVHKEIADRIKAEIAKGKNARNVAIDFLLSLRESEFSQTVQRIFGTHATGLALTGIAAGLAKWLQTVNWEKIGIDDQSGTMRQVRLILQNVLPSLIVGGAEALSDTFEEDVVSAVARVRSDETAVSPQPKGAFDLVYEILSNDGIDYAQKYGLLFPEWGPDGGYQYERDAVVLAGANGRQFMQDWYATHKGEWIDDPNFRPPPAQNGRGGNNNTQNARPQKIWRDAEPYKGRLVPLATAILRTPVTTPMDPELVAAAKAALKEKPKAAPKEEKLDEHGRRFQYLVSNTIANMTTEAEQSIARDLLSDTASKPKQINALGKLFNDRAVNDRFSDTDMKAIYEHARTWMGATLTLENRFSHAFAQAKSAMKTGEGLEAAIGKFAHTVGRWSVYTAMFLLTVFVSSLLLYVYGGFFVDVSQTKFIWSTKTDWIFFVPTIIVGLIGLVLQFQRWWYDRKAKEVDADGNPTEEAIESRSRAQNKQFLANTFWIPTIVSLMIVLLGIAWPSMLQVNAKSYAVALVFITATVMILEMLLCTVVEAALAWKWVQFLIPSFTKESLKNKGRIYCMVIGVIGALALGLVHYDVSNENRAYVLGILFLVAVATQFGLTATGAKDEADERTRKTLRAVSWLVLVLAIFVIGSLVLSAFGLSVSGLVTSFASALWLQALLIFLVVAFSLYVIILIGSAISTSGETGDVKYQDKPSVALRIVALLIALGVAGWYYHTKDLERQKAQVQTPTVASVIQQILAPSQPVPVTPTPTVATTQPRAIVIPTAVPAIAHHARTKGNVVRHVQNQPEDDEEDPCAGYSEDLKRRMRETYGDCQ